MKYLLWVQQSWCTTKMYSYSEYIYINQYDAPPTLTSPNVCCLSVCDSYYTPRPNWQFGGVTSTRLSRVLGHDQSVSWCYPGPGAWRLCHRSRPICGQSSLLTSYIVLFGSMSWSRHAWKQVFRQHVYFIMTLHSLKVPVLAYVFIIVCTRNRISRYSRLEKEDFFFKLLFENVQCHLNQNSYFWRLWEWWCVQPRSFFPNSFCTVNCRYIFLMFQSSTPLKVNKPNI